MLFADTVRNRGLHEKPRIILALFVLSSLLAWWAGGGPAGHAALFPAREAALGLLGDLGMACLLGAAFTANLVLISRFRFRLQVLIVWAELLTLFLLFFLAFDLSFPFILKKLPYLITQGAVTTVYVSAISIAIASVIAIIGAVAKLSSNGFAFAVASFYTSLFRGLPLLVQIYLLYLGLPQLGIYIDAIPAGIIALSLCYGAYMTEVFRAGILSIPAGQWEASRSMGFKFGLTMRRIILPQSVPVIIPPLGNQFIAMLKDSSLVSVLGIWELMFLARTLGNKEFRHLEMLITVAVIYWVLTILFELVQARIEAYFQKHRKR